MGRRKKLRNIHIYQDVGIVALSMLVALLLANSTALHEFLAQVGEKRLLGSFLAGSLFTSVFTTAPAIVLLGEMAKVNSVWLVAITGALGALSGDYIIFRFVRDRVSEDIDILLKDKKRRVRKLLRLR